MKITKNKLRSIIKEERAKLLKEMMTPGERSLGAFASASAVDEAEAAMARVVQSTSESAFAELADEEDADEASKAALAQLMSNVCQSMGYLDIYMELQKFTGKR